MKYGQEIAGMLIRFAELADDSDESKQVRYQLTRLRMVLAAFVLFYSDFQLRSFAACSNCRKKPTARYGRC